MPLYASSTFRPLGKSKSILCRQDDERVFDPACALFYHLDLLFSDRDETAHRYYTDTAHTRHWHATRYAAGPVHIKRRRVRMHVDRYTPAAHELRNALPHWTHTDGPFGLHIASSRLASLWDHVHSPTKALSIISPRWDAHHRRLSLCGAYR